MPKHETVSSNPEIAEAVQIKLAYGEEHLVDSGSFIADEETTHKELGIGFGARLKAIVQPDASVEPGAEGALFVLELNDPYTPEFMGLPESCVSSDAVLDPKGRPFVVMSQGLLRDIKSASETGQALRPVYNGADYCYLGYNDSVLAGKDKGLLGYHDMSSVSSASKDHVVIGLTDEGEIRVQDISENGTGLVAPKAPVHSL